MTLLALAMFLLAADPASPAPVAAPAAVANLRPVAGSHVSGTARFTPSAGGLEVAIALDGMFIPETQYPASVRAGRCSDAGAALTATLRPVQAGSSLTTLAGTSAADLIRTPHSVRIMDATGQRVLWCGRVRAPGAKPAN